VVRAAERPLPVERAVRLELPEQASDLRHLQRLVAGQGRQDAGQAAGQHRLARPRRAREEQVMAACGGNLERSPCLVLPVHLGQVVERAGLGGDGRLGRPVLGGGLQGKCPGQDLAQVPAGMHGEPRRQSRLLRIPFRHEHRSDAELPQRQCRHEHALDAPHPPVQPQLSHVGDALRRGAPLRGQLDCDRERQVQRRAVLPHLRRREIDDDPAVRELDAAVAEGRADPRRGLTNRGRRQADQLDAVGAGPGDVALDVDEAAVETVGQAGQHGGVHSAGSVPGAGPCGNAAR
jgi:hypothetical protein